MTYKEAYYKALALVRQWRATAKGGNGMPKSGNGLLMRQSRLPRKP
jgi:hypothetical protein